MATSKMKEVSISQMNSRNVEERGQEWLDELHRCMPSFTSSLHKGQSGRIGIVGGSDDYTGAPYYASMAALRCGADLVHIFCTPSAAQVLKSYGPEAIVHGILTGGDVTEAARDWLARLHCIVLGPGLGRKPEVLESAASIVRIARSLSLPLVVDADGLWMAMQDPKLIACWPNGRIVLTPNVMEFSNLSSKTKAESIEELAEILQGTILLKGGTDYAVSPKGGAMICGTGGSGRRCGGQGDLLSGALGVFLHWACQAKKDEESSPAIDPTLLASYGACRLTKECNMRTFNKLGRSSLTVDMLSEIHAAFSELFEGE